MLVCPRYRHEHSLVVGELMQQRAQHREHVQAVIAYLLSSVNSGARELDKENTAAEQDAKAQQAAAMLQTVLHSDAPSTTPIPAHNYPISKLTKPHASTTRLPLRRRSSSSKAHDRRQLQQTQQPADSDDSSYHSLPPTHEVTLGARISRLQLQLAHAHEQRSTQQQHATFLAAQVNTLQQDKANLSSQLHALHRQQASDKQQAKRREQELQAQLSQLQASQRSEQQWNELQSDVDACKQAVRAAKEELQRKMRLLVAAQQEQQRLEASIKQLEAEAAEKDKRMSKLHRQCQAKDATAVELQEEVRELKARQEHATEAERTTRLEMDELCAACTRSQQQVTELHDSALEKELLIASLRRELSELEKQAGEGRLLFDRQVEELQMWQRKERDTQSTLTIALSQLEEAKQHLSNCHTGQGQPSAICLRSQLSFRESQSVHLMRSLLLCVRSRPTATRRRGQHLTERRSVAAQRVSCGSGEPTVSSS